MSAAPVDLPPIHWSAIQLGNPPDPDDSARHTKDQMAAEFAAMTVAHMTAYANATRGDKIRDGEELRAAIDQHLHPGITAFAAAAALKGWSTEQINDAFVFGAPIHEFSWQWLSEAGVSVETMLRLNADLNAPGVITSL